MHLVRVPQQGPFRHNCIAPSKHSSWNACADTRGPAMPPLFFAMSKCAEDWYENVISKASNEYRYWWKLKWRTGKIRTSLFQILSRKRKKVIIADSNSNPKLTDYRQAYFINDPLFSQLNLLCPLTLTIGEKKCDINYYMLRGLSFFYSWKVIRFGKIPTAMESLSNTLTPIYIHNTHLLD